LIADTSKKDVTTPMQRVFHDIRKGWNKPKSEEIADLYLLDDIYFGDSKTSFGIQLADICVYTIARFMAGKPDIVGFYDIIRGQIHARLAFLDKA
jgi:hypothetical protein